MVVEGGEGIGEVGPVTRWEGGDGGLDTWVASGRPRGSAQVGPELCFGAEEVKEWR